MARQHNTLAEYGGRIIVVDGRETVELVDPNDNAQKRFQYRVNKARNVERRVLCADGEVMDDGSPWRELTDRDISYMQHIRGQYHPILDPLGL